MECKEFGLPYFMRYITIIPMIHHKEKVTYFSNKKLIVDVFGVCAERYVEDLKGQANKTITL